jgi:signal peptidase II
MEIKTRHWLGLAGVVIVLDQVTKYWALQALNYGDPVAITPGFNLMLVYNTGAAFSLLSDASGWQRWFFAAVALVVSVVITVWLSRLDSDQWWLPAALALILGGAIGNFWDRITIGYVIDFIQLYYQKWTWPAFNVADSAICVGAAMLLLSGWRQNPEESNDN